MPYSDETKQIVLTYLQLNGSCIETAKYLGISIWEVYSALLWRDSILLDLQHAQSDQAQVEREV